MEQAQLDAFLQRMDARRKREEIEATPEETEEQRQNKLSESYLKRTKRTEMSAEGGKGPRLVKNED